MSRKPRAVPAGQTLKKLTVNKNMQYVLFLIKKKFAHTREIFKEQEVSS